MAPGAKYSLFRQLRSGMWDHNVMPLVNLMYDLDKGYLARVLVVGCVGYASCSSLSEKFKTSQESLPLAKRFYRFQPSTPVTLVEKRQEPGTETVVYRFRLPNSYDYAGYEPVSAVLVGCGLEGHWRYLNPISPPEARGYIEFQVAHSSSTRTLPHYFSKLQTGDRIHLHRWIKEFQYKPNTYGELGVVCTTSGASIITQLMQAMEKDKTDSTKLKALYINKTEIFPFKETLFKSAVERSGGRFSIKYMATAPTGHHFPDGYIGILDDDVLQDVLPPPLVRKQPPRTKETGNAALSAEEEASLPTVRSQILVSCKAAAQTQVCGCRRLGQLHYEKYRQPWSLQYKGGILDRLGYLQSQVYAFGIVESLLIS
jgi:hypothetical protein